jgi:hypothetical protein
MWGFHMAIISLLSVVVEGQQLKSLINRSISIRQIDCQNVSEMIALVITFPSARNLSGFF